MGLALLTVGFVKLGFAAAGFPIPDPLGIGNRESGPIEVKTATSTGIELAVFWPFPTKTATSTGMELAVFWSFS